MTRTVLALVLMVFAVLACPMTISADVLLIEEVRQAGKMDVPENGMTSTEVSARFGEPLKKHSPVGDPPIKQWEYDGWSVYFEYDLVLFTVLHKTGNSDKKQE